IGGAALGLRGVSRRGRGRPVTPGSADARRLSRGDPGVGPVRPALRRAATLTVARRLALPDGAPARGLESLRLRARRVLARPRAPARSAEEGRLRLARTLCA